MGFRATGLQPPAAPGAIEADEDDYDAHRLAHGLADTGRDALAEKTYPIEANLDLLHGIDFRKGCFVGQETTSRMKRRGPVKTRLLPVTMDGPAPPAGTEVLAGDLRAGEIVGGRDGRALALLRLDRIEGAQLTAEGRSLRTATPQWLVIEPTSTD
jgi:folate-binding protein YgfZ